jgi:serine/threonine protein phosphatase PrpC
MGANPDLTLAPAPAQSPALANRWRAVAASVAGASHLGTGQPCQDAHCMHIAGDVFIAAVADGAGSAPKSALGARTAAEVAVNFLRSKLCQGESRPDDEITWTEVMSEALAAARMAVLELAEACGEDPRLFAATLSCAACAGEWVMAGQIGDGIVVLQDQAGALEMALAPQRGEYANETSFITEDDALAQAQYLMPRRQALTGIALSTDGLLRLAVSLADHAPHTKFFQPLFAFARSAEDAAAGATLAEFLSSERVSARSDDDKTLVLAVLAP